MSRSTSTFLLVTSLLAGCLADPGDDGPAPALTGSGETALAEDGGSDTELIKHSDSFPSDAASDALSDDAGSASPRDAAGPSAPDAAPEDGPRDGAADDDAAPLSEDDGGSAGDDGGESPPPDDAGEPPPDPALGCAVASTLASRCVGCHGAAARNGVELDALDKLSKESAKVPGELTAQRIVARMRDADRPMPPRGELVPEAEIAAVEAWIAAGMPAASCP
jgi:mono/diheme cytochrome c family protein